MIYFYYSHIFFRTFLSNGNSYTGELRQDKAHGKGEFTWDDGSKQVGNYIDGKNEGSAMYYDKNGKKENRFYKDGKIVK